MLLETNDDPNVTIAFHHIDNHLDLTPLEYMLQRYQTGEDLEELSKANRTLSEEEEKKMKDGATVVVEGVKRTIEDVTNRKKLKQSFVEIDLVVLLGQALLTIVSRRNC